MWQWSRLRLSIRIVPRAKGEKGIEFRFKCSTRLMSSPERYLLSRVFRYFFNNPFLIQKLHDNGLYGLGTARSNRINITQMKKDKKMKQRNYECRFYNHIACIRWYDNKSVMLLGSQLGEITSTSTVHRRLNGSSSQISANYPNGITLYNSKMGGVDLMDQLKSAYQLGGRSKFWFCLRLFFALFDVALVNSFIVHMENKDLTLKKFKICIALKLIASFVSRKLSGENHCPSKRTKAQRPGPISPSHLQIFLETRRRCTVCSKAGKENRTFVTCSSCDVVLCLQKEKNCFLQ